MSYNVDNRIQRLDEITASKIAAGEVVEKPAMVVKELVENSVDSGASQITIETKKGGKDYIRVTDNGSGINRQDMDLVFERHATSKIRKIEDLYNTVSLGFRGEALSSICAVSIIEMITKKEEDETGISVEASGGKIHSIKEIGANVGTTIIVKNLFFNTPARMKFLKTDRSEQSYISELVNNIAISHPEISINYIVDGKSVYITPGKGHMVNTILSIYDKNMAKNIIPIESQVGTIKVKGYISNIQHYKGTSRNIISFVNGRFVKNDAIKESVRLAYKGMIPIGKFPVAFVFLDINPSEVDVNIHPAKTEIKFHKEGEIKQAIYSLIKKNLNIYNQTTKVTFTEKEVFTYENTGQKVDKAKVAEKSTFRADSTNLTRQENLFDKVKNVENSPLEDKKQVVEKIESEEIKEIREKVDSKEVQEKIDSKEIGKSKERQETNEVEKLEKVEVLKSVKEKDRIEDEKDKKVDFSRNAKIEIEETFIKTDNAKTNNNLYDKLKSPDLLNAQINKTLKEMNSFSEEIEMNSQVLVEESVYDDLVYCGALFSTYLLFEKNNSMYMIDQHAAHEKVLYEEFIENYKNEKIVSQILMLPITITTSKTTLMKFKGDFKEINKWGFNIEEFGDDTVVIREIPSNFAQGEAEDLVKNALEEMPEIYDQSKVDDVIQHSCKKAIKANDKINPHEVEGLLKRLKRLEFPYTCPHGRPIIIEITKKELEKKFKRII